MMTFIYSKREIVYSNDECCSYWEYLIHHLVTIFLIGVSFYTRIQR